MREKLVSRELNPLLASLPDKFEEIYPYQIEAVTETVEAFESGTPVVVLEGPTGSGKTLIAECVRRMLDTRAVFMCHNKSLQEQFAGDFPYSRVLWGRANYTPQNVLEGATCEDCTWTQEVKKCLLCPDRDRCPYLVAKVHAIHSPVPVLNSAYWLNETSQGKRSRFANTGLTVIDEADTLEPVLMGQVEIYVGDRMQSRYGIDPPSRMTKEYSYLDWTKKVLDLLREPITGLSRPIQSIGQMRELSRLVTLQGNVLAMQNDLVNNIPWVYTGGAGSNRRSGKAISFKPIMVSRFGPERVWNKDKRFLFMSGSPNLHLDLQSLGWTTEYRRVTMESRFHPKNRQLVVRPIADMTRKGQEDESNFRALRDGLHRILREHNGQRILIHSVSYNLAARISGGSGRDWITYQSSGNRTSALQRYQRTVGAVLVAPSLDRGVDLPGDACRAQVIVKVPFPNLGDKQVSERYYKSPGGKVWYNNLVARTLVQMVGRGVRSEDDYCTAYILDSTFIGWYRTWGHLFPDWFRKAIRFER